MPSFAPINCLNGHLIQVSEEEEYEFAHGRYFKRIATLGPGHCFGEHALQRRCARTATIKTESVMQLACLSKAQYDETLFNLVDSMERARIEALQQLAVFRKMSLKTIQGFYHQFQRLLYKNG